MDVYVLLIILSIIITVILGILFAVYLGYRIGFSIKLSNEESADKEPVRFFRPIGKARVTKIPEEGESEEE